MLINEQTNFSKVKNEKKLEGISTIPDKANPIYKLLDRLPTPNDNP